MKHFGESDFVEFEKQYRTNLINSAPGAKGVYLVGTRNMELGISNLAVFNSVFHVGANPPYLGMVVRPDSVDRHTWQNIQQTGFYTLNQVSGAMVKQAHQTSARYEAEVSEFEAVGLKEEFLMDFAAPYVGESAVKFGLKLTEFHRVEANGTIVVIGEIQHLWVAEGALQEDGFVDIGLLGAAASAGLDAYFGLEKIGRLSYAKKDKEPKWL